MIPTQRTSWAWSPGRHAAVGDQQSMTAMATQGPEKCAQTNYLTVEVGTMISICLAAPQPQLTPTLRPSPTLVW